MKISYKELTPIPKEISPNFGFCSYDALSNDLKLWVEYHKLHVEHLECYTNIFIPQGINVRDLFYDLEPHVVFDYMDGFSPNLNKNLHIGHLSNLVLAKAFKSLSVVKEIVALLGDTLTNQFTLVTKKEALDNLYKYLIDFNVDYDAVYFASSMVHLLEVDLNLQPGEDQWEGTQVFVLPDGTKIVGVKSDGSTSYFYQDVVLASLLQRPTLYLTGAEQSNHFSALKSLYPSIEHIGLGLLTLNGSKMSSRVGNVIYVEDFIDSILSDFNNDIQLVYNVCAGFILKSKPEKNKSINTDLLTNVKNSQGLYISYTMARLYSAGLYFKCSEHFSSQELEFAYCVSRTELNPSRLFSALVDHCKDINFLYGTNKIVDNEHNQKMFQVLLSDLLLGARYLGLFWVKKV